MERIPELSIITVNYNGLNDTCELIDSVKKNVTLSYELIVVDNASASEEANLIKNRYPWIILIKNEKNLGFAAGNNSGLMVSRGKYVLFLNNDTLVKDDSFHFLIERLESNPLIGAVSPKIKFSFSPEIIQFAGYTRLSAIGLRNRTIGFGEKDKGQYNTPACIPYLHGAAMMLKRETLDKIGRMPEIYFLYYEELDWCEKMTRHGYKLYYEPLCVVYHKESQSTGQESPLRTFYITRNRLLFAFRNIEGMSKYLSIVYQVSIVLIKNSLLFLLKKRTDLIKASFSGIFSFFCIKNKTC
ncbi:MAG: glycosyltransferase family 2 protein [Mangrovibacterium sp.]